MRPIAPRVLLALLLLAAPFRATRTEAVEFGPQGIVRQFALLDARGGRTSGNGWQHIAPLVAWGLEPAWDQIVLITGYTVGSPAAIAPGVFGVEVTYRVLGRITPDGMETAVFEEHVVFETSSPDGAGWVVRGPPLPPHILANLVDIPAMRHGMRQGRRGFLPNSLLVWHLFDAAGWSLPFELAADLPAAGHFRTVAEPAPGDVVAYSWNGQPYHVGVLDADGSVVSSTLNYGMVRSTLESFPGEPHFLRLVQPAAPPCSDGECP